MTKLSQPRRKFLNYLTGLSIVIASIGALSGKLRAQQGQGTRPTNNPKSGEDDNAPYPLGSRKVALEENEKDIKKKVEKLFQLASELKEEVDKTDSVKVLSVAMLKKADEIERLAKDIKARAKG
jgi:hypothetical protein